jgi:hypothetical protein
MHFQVLGAIFGKVMTESLKKEQAYLYEKICLDQDEGVRSVKL